MSGDAEMFLLFDFFNILANLTGQDFSNSEKIATFVNFFGKPN
jgi:hypothetical protein